MKPETRSACVKHMAARRVRAIILVLVAGLMMGFPNLERATAMPEPLLFDMCDQNCGINLDAPACLAREQACRAKLDLYYAYMGQLGLGVSLHRLPQLYIDLLQPHYPGATLSNWRFGFSDRQPPNNATTDCSNTYYNNSAFVDRLRDGRLESDGNFRWLLHELQHFVQCTQGGGRDRYAKRWFGELEMTLLQNSNLATLHDRMPMEGDANNVEGQILGRIAEIRDLQGRLVRPLSIRVLHNSSNVGTITLTHNAEVRLVADSGGGSDPLEFEWRVRVPGSSTFQRRTGSGNNGTRLDLTLDLIGAYEVQAKVFQPNSNLRAAETTARLNVIEPPPAAPATPQAQGISPTSIRVSWQDASNNESGFRIERLPRQTGVSRVFQAPANATSFDESGLLPGTQYRYKVCAENVGGTTCSNIFTGSTLPPTELAAPVEVIVTGRTENTITLSWHDISLETGFKVEREIDGVFRVVSTVPANTTEAMVKLLQPNTLYRFRICASDGARSMCSAIEARTTPIS